MNFITFSTGKDDIDRRIDKVIRIFVKNLPLSQIYKALRSGLIKVNNKKIKQDYHIVEGDKIQIADFLINQNNENENSQNAINQNNSTNNLKTKSHNNFLNIKDIILFENENFLILNKPSNINVHSSTKNDLSLQIIVEQYVSSQKKEESLSFKTGPLHRLDRMTSGIIAFSKSTNGARWFSSQIAEHNITKKYLALLQGKLQQAEEWTDFLVKENDKDENYHTVKITDDENAKECKTKVIPLKYGKYKNDDVTLAEVYIFTGRQHQIRAQCSKHGFPLLGDTAYNGKKLSDTPVFFLHAQELTIPQNDLGLPEKIQAPLPQNFSKFCINDCDIKFFDI